MLKDLSVCPVIRLANVNLKTELASGTMKVEVIVRELLIRGVQFLLENDLAGKLIVPNSTVLDHPLNENSTHEHLSSSVRVT